MKFSGLACFVPYRIECNTAHGYRFMIGCHSNKQWRRVRADMYINH